MVGAALGSVLVLRSRGCSASVAVARFVPEPWVQKIPEEEPSSLLSCTAPAGAGTESPFRTKVGCLRLIPLDVASAVPAGARPAPFGSGPIHPEITFFYTIGSSLFHVDGLRNDVAVKRALFL